MLIGLVVLFHIKDTCKHIGPGGNTSRGHTHTVLNQVCLHNLLCASVVLLRHVGTQHPIAQLHGTKFKTSIIGSRMHHHCTMRALHTTWAIRTCAVEIKPSDTKSADLKPSNVWHMFWQKMHSFILTWKYYSFTKLQNQTGNWRGNQGCFWAPAAPLATVQSLVGLSDFGVGHVTEKCLPHFLAQQSPSRWARAGIALQEGTVASTKHLRKTWCQLGIKGKQCWRQGKKTIENKAMLEGRCKKNKMDQSNFR
jgi:hypothetical protein